VSHPVDHGLEIVAGDRDRPRAAVAVVAAAMNVSRLPDWFGGVPRAKTRISQFARLAA
jgi:hypothetical protein